MIVWADNGGVELPNQALKDSTSAKIHQGNATTNELPASPWMERNSVIARSALLAFPSRRRHGRPHLLDHLRQRGRRGDRRRVRHDRHERRPGDRTHPGVQLTDGDPVTTAALNRKGHLARLHARPAHLNCDNTYPTSTMKRHGIKLSELSKPGVERRRTVSCPQGTIVERSQCHPWHTPLVDILCCDGRGEVTRGVVSDLECVGR